MQMYDGTDELAVVRAVVANVDLLEAGPLTAADLVPFDVGLGTLGTVPAAGFVRVRSSENHGVMSGCVALRCVAGCGGIDLGQISSVCMSGKRRVASLLPCILGLAHESSVE